jgi:hypothetical protein
MNCTQENITGYKKKRQKCDPSGKRSREIDGYLLKKLKIYIHTKI